MNLIEILLHLDGQSPEERSKFYKDTGVARDLINLIEACFGTDRRLQDSSGNRLVVAAERKKARK